MNENKLKSKIATSLPKYLLAKNSLVHIYIIIKSLYFALRYFHGAKQSLISFI